MSDHVNIDNNVFGYIIKGIKISNIDECDLKSNRINEPIQNNDLIEENEILELFLKEEEYEITSCTISFSLIITQPDYEEYKLYIKRK